MRSDSYQNFGLTGSTIRLEVRPTLFLGNAPEVVYRGPIDAKIERDAARIHFVLRFGFWWRFCGRRWLLRADYGGVLTAIIQATMPTTNHRPQRPVIVIWDLIVEMGSAGLTQPSQ